MISPDPILPGQESVWAYPRPAIAQACARRVQIIHKGISIADTKNSIRTLETSHPPSYYIPRADIAVDLLSPSSNSSFCEWKGSASYWNVSVSGETFANVGWSYANPSHDFEMLRDHIAFYAGPFEGCFIDGERVVPQEGGFYGGWITSHVAGPFKGVPGSRFW
jgi:uncharacterized protein (DUF427 family)